MDDELKTVYREFLNNMRAEKDASESTISSYSTDYKTFQKFLQLQGIEPRLQTITTRDLRKYVNYLKIGKEYSNGTVRRKIHSLSSFFKFSLEMEYIDKNPMLPIHAPRLEERLPIFISENDLRKLLEAPQKYARFHSHINRDRAMMGLLIYTGARKSEVLNLNWGDIDFREEIVHIRQGKGRKDREIPLMEPLAMILLDYYNERHPKMDEPILLSDCHERLSKTAFQTLFKRYLIKCGLGNKHYTIHKCRHSFATLLYENGVDLLAIQKMLGHRDLNSTKIYTHLTNAHMKEEVKKFPKIISV
ncbi:Recombinase XerC [Ruminococcaceae bacterium BL-6]|nr:Recombinase XerC [Ruminococcaceae bacterium BL-6]HBG55952.1 recombinase XerC [Oscillospiraceae bacterium]